MATTRIDEIRGIQLRLLKELVSICERHSIRYFLFFGSLLGAVRHAGFIPWDDDIDVGMFREDYERFLSVASAELSPQTFLQTFETDPAYPEIFGKLRDIGSVYMEEYTQNIRGMNHGVFIDIFPLDYVPQRKPEAVCLMTLLGLFYRMYKIRFHRSRSADRSRRAVRTALYYTFKVLIPVRPARLRARFNRLCKTIDARYRSRGEFVGTLCQPTARGDNRRFRAEWFAELMQAPFAGLQVSIPRRYHDILAHHYGDYMVLPPESERVLRHNVGYQRK